MALEWMVFGVDECPPSCAPPHTTRAANDLVVRSTVWVYAL